MLMDFGPIRLGQSYSNKNGLGFALPLWGKKEKRLQPICICTWRKSVHSINNRRITHQDPAAEGVVGGERQEGAAVEDALDLGVVEAKALVVEGVLPAIMVEEDQLTLCLLHVVLGSPETTSKRVRVATLIIFYKGNCKCLPTLSVPKIPNKMS